MSRSSSHRTTIYPFWQSGHIVVQQINNFLSFMISYGKKYLNFQGWEERRWNTCPWYCDDPADRKGPDVPGPLPSLGAASSSYTTQESSAWSHRLEVRIFFMSLDFMRYMNPYMALDTISSGDQLSIFCELNLNCQLYLKLFGIRKVEFF